MVVIKVTFGERLAINTNQKKPMNQDAIRLSVGRFKVMPEMGMQVARMNQGSLAVIFNKEENMARGMKVLDEDKYVTRLGWRSL